jgi:acetyl esterase/lipase
MISPTAKRFVCRVTFVISLVALSVLATGCVVPNPGPANKVPANYVAHVNVSIPNIQYGADPSQLLNLYLPAPNQRPAPVLVYMHSGGFVAGDRTGVPEGILREVLRGYAVASIEYHLSPQSRFPVALQDAKTAVRWAKVRGGQYALRTDEVFAAGMSAGGNLAAMVALTPGQFEPTNLPADLAAVSSTVRGAITLSGVLNCNDVSRIGWGTGFIPAYVGSLDPIAMAQASPVNYVTPSAPPMYIANGYLDGLVRADANARMMALRYLQVGRARVAFYDMVDNQGHNLDVDGMNTTALDFWLDGVRDGRLA